MADEVAAAAELVMGKAAGVPARDRARPRPRLVPRGTVPRAGPPTRRGPLPVSEPHERPCARRSIEAARRSIRAFLPEPVPRDVLDALVEAACIAPAPHHSRPWRWVVVDDADGQARARRRHGRALAARPRRRRRRAERASTSSSTRRTRKITGAPALVLGCLTWHGLDRYPDDGRQRAEWGMALLSLGAAVENLMLAAADARLRVVLGRGAHLLSRGGARRARAPRPEWLPHAMILVGRPDPAYVGRPAAAVPLDELRARSAERTRTSVSAGRRDARPEPVER